MEHLKLFGWMGLMVGLSYLTLCAVAPRRLLVEVDVPVRTSDMDRGGGVHAAWPLAVHSSLSEESKSAWSWPLAGGDWTVSEDKEGVPIHLDYVSDRASLRLEFSAEHSGGGSLEKLQVVSTRWPFAWRGAALLSGARGQVEGALGVAADALLASK